MKRSSVPFNISILNPSPEKLRDLRPIRVTDIFDGAGTNFHEDGMFSTTIFGKSGDDRRSNRFSYIHTKVSVFHPVLYRALVALKRMYAGIMAGTEMVLWDEQLCDFVRSDAVNGKTGFHYFVTHWEKIKFETTKSVMREQHILMLRKYMDIALANNIIVMPAGLRDIEVGDDGRTQEDEINGLYRQVLAISNTVSEAAVRSNPDILNNARHSLQMKFNEIYETIENMIEGKKKLIMAKFASRRIFNGTRNVITAMNTSVAYLGAPGAVGFNNTIIGLYQGMKAMMPVARYFIRNGFLAKVFSAVDLPAKLVNKETLRSESVQLKSQDFDRWMTDEGIEKVITSFGEEGLRNKPIEIKGYYLGLMYKGPDGTFKIIQDIDEVPGTRSKLHVTPLTFCELMYLSGYTKWNKYPLFLTRYPVTGTGSIYPSRVYMKTTIKSEIRRELDENWEPMSEDNTAYEFPTDGAYVNSLVPHSAKLVRLGADFDGDTCSANVSYSDEAIQEVNEYLDKRSAYVGTDGRFISSTNVSTVALVLHNLTGP